MNKIFFTAFSIALICTTSLHAQTINTIAGNGNAGYSGDGNAATSAELNNPSGTAVDNNGNVYIVDHLNNRIRKINAGGIITTIAGTGTAGYNGDGIAATSAQLNEPFGIGVDGNGNVYIADCLNRRVRMIDTAGIIYTIAGNGTVGYTGDGGAATSAELEYPNGVAIDHSGNVYIADMQAYVVRKVNTSGIISTFAGTGTYGFSGDGGPATGADMGRVQAVALDSAANLYITDDGVRIRKVDGSGDIHTIAGNGMTVYAGDGGPATSASIDYASGVAVDGYGKVYIADVQARRIRVIGTNDTITTFAGTGTWGFSGDGGPATSAEIYYSTGICVDAVNNIYISDNSNNRVRKIDATTGISYFKSPGKDLKLYPNANSGAFTVSGQVNTTKNSLQAQVVDMSGKVVLSANVPVLENKIDCNFMLSENLPGGQYLFRLLSASGSTTIKFEKK